jgi:hypothetical protein
MLRAASAHRAWFALAVLAALPLAAAAAPQGRAPDAAGSAEGAAPTGAGAPRPGPPAGSEDVAHILKEAQRAQTVDIAAWSRFSFRRVWLREEFDETGARVSGERLEFAIRPEGGAFDELLVSRNGAPPTAKEVEEHRKEARFTRHYLTMVRGDAQSSEGGYSLAHLLHMSSYRYAGREEFEGVPCHRLDFSPDPQETRGGLSGKFAGAMVGSLWISQDGHHLAGAHSWTVKPISIYLGLSKVHALDVRMTSRPTGDGYWLPHRIEVRSKVRILFRTVDRRSLFEYLDFAPVRSDASISAGV